MRKLLLILGLALCAWPCFGQQVLPINSGVVIANMQNGTTFFKVSLTENVTSLSIIGQQANVTSATIIFQQDNTGGRTVTFASNITGCTVTGTANASTVCVFTYDPGTASWFGTGGGSVSLPTTLSAPGVFDNTAMHTNWIVTINGCNLASIFSVSQFNDVAMDAESSCLSVPATGVNNGFNSAYHAYVTNASPASGCQQNSGLCAAMGVSVDGISTAAGNATFGLNSIVRSTVGKPAVLVGAEIDVSPQNTGDSGEGLTLSGNFEAQVSGDNLPAIHITPCFRPGSCTGAWTEGITMETGSIEAGQDAIRLLPYVTGANAASPPVSFYGINSSGVLEHYGWEGRGAGTGGAHMGLQLLGNPSTGLVSTIFTMTGASGAGLGTLNISGPISLPTFTVSTLPSASTAGAGAMVRVSDASTFTVGTCTGGGSDFMIAISDGATWSCH